MSPDRLLPPPAGDLPSTVRTIAATALAPETPEDLTDLEELRTLVTLLRRHPRDIGQRQVFVRIDDGPRVALLFGQSLTVEVKPGTHRLRAHNTLMWKTVTFHVEAGEHLEFQLINRGGPLTYSVAALLGAAPLFLSIERRSLV
jgi:hypothetical protein